MVLHPAATQSFTITVTDTGYSGRFGCLLALDEAAGTIYADVTGINDGTGNPSPTAISGQVNGGQHFDGTTTKIEVPASTTFDFAADGDFSVEFWYKGTATIIRMIIGTINIFNSQMVCSIISEW